MNSYLGSALLKLSKAAPLLAKTQKRLTPGFVKLTEIEKNASITREEAIDSLNRLQRLETTRPTAGEVTRGALVGGAVGPTAALASRAIMGPNARFPTKLYPGHRGMLAAGAQGAVLGGLVPAFRHKLDREAEKHKIKKYLGETRHGSLRSRIKETTGL